jgi:hypothetical protein
MPIALIAKDLQEFCTIFLKKNLKINLIISSKNINSCDLQRGSFIPTVDIYFVDFLDLQNVTCCL